MGADVSISEGMSLLYEMEAGGKTLKSITEGFIQLPEVPGLYETLGGHVCQAVTPPKGLTVVSSLCRSCQRCSTVTKSA